MPVCAIATGSNIGKAETHIRQGIEELAKHVQVLRVSSFYKTKPMYVTDQPDFINGAALIQTELSPLALLRVLKQVEKEIGRAPGERYGPRVLDLDLIYYGKLQYRFEESGKSLLEIPHPLVAERRFVLAPLAEIEPEGIIPGLGSLIDLLQRTNKDADCVMQIAYADLRI